MGGIEDSMQEHALGKAALEVGKLAGWMDWAGRHPGIVLLGALAVAILAVQDMPKAEEASFDSSDEEVPLFI